MLQTDLLPDLVEWLICHASFLLIFLLTSPLLVHYKEKHAHSTFMLIYGTLSDSRQMLFPPTLKEINHDEC